MRINQNNDISIYRGETCSIDFKISQRADYYVPFLISSARVNPMVCITIGSTRRESNNIVSKQLWLDLDNLQLPRFNQTTVTDLETITVAQGEVIADILAPLMTAGIMYQFRLQSEVLADIDQLHFAYLVNDVVVIDDYDFTVVISLDETISLDMTSLDYFYQIELMDTEPMTQHLIELFTSHPELIGKLPTNFTVDEIGVNSYLTECINLITKTFPTHWGYRITNPLNSPVASVSNIQMLQSPKKFTVQSVVK